MKEIDYNKQLVPFGKYKGQPVAVMQNDTQYCEWLSTQDWFRERYANVYNQVIINNFTEPTETPEHNRLQMKFLDDDFCLSLMNKVLDFSLESNFRKSANAVKKLKKHAQEFFSENPHYKSEEILENYTDFIAQYCLIKDFFTLTNKEFEDKAFDVVLKCSYYRIGKYDRRCFKEKEKQIFNDEVYINPETLPIFVEIKPCLGDDFPAVLRQIKTNSKIKIDKHYYEDIYGIKVLIIDKFTAEGATFEQVKQVFELSNIKLLPISEIEE